MKEEPINPGYINHIFPIPGWKQTNFNRSEFFNAILEDGGLKFDYGIDVVIDFIKLSLTIKYIQKAKENDNGLEVISFFRSFRVVKVADIYPKDLLVVLEHCISILNQEMKEQNPPLKYLPEKFAIPVWEDHILLLEQIAQGLNDKVQYP